MTESINNEITVGECQHLDLRTGEEWVAKYPVGFHCIDDGNAERFLWQFSESIRYCFERNTWYIWDQTRYKPDTTGLIYELAKDAVRRIHYEVGDILGKGHHSDLMIALALAVWAADYDGYSGGPTVW